MTKQYKVFLDRNILSYSIILETTIKTQTLKWGDTDDTCDIHGYIRKSKRGDWIDDEVACLPTIASMASKEILHLYVGVEVQHESLSANSVGRGTKGDLFRGVQINHCDNPICRSYFKSQTIDQICDKKELIYFCEMLMKVDAAMLMKVPEFWNRFPDSMKDNFGKIDRLKELLKALTHKGHWPDAFHLWTAECFGADFFLTVDQKFINALTRTARIPLPVPIVKPSDLLGTLGVKERLPLPFEEGKFINLMEA